MSYIVKFRGVFCCLRLAEQKFYAIRSYSALALRNTKCSELFELSTDIESVGEWARKNTALLWINVLKIKNIWDLRGRPGQSEPICSVSCQNLSAQRWRHPTPAHMCRVFCFGRQAVLKKKKSGTKWQAGFEVPMPWAVSQEGYWPDTDHREALSEQSTDDAGPSSAGKREGILPLPASCLMRLEVWTVCPPELLYGGPC